VATPVKRPFKDAAAPAGPETGATPERIAQASPDVLRDEALARLDAALDEALSATFPASDPIAVHLPNAR
jgi:hypothetical protein